MDKMKKGKLARRAKSFKEDVIDIFANLRTPTNSVPPQYNFKSKPLPVTPQTPNGDGEQDEILTIIENLPSSINLNQHFTSEINKNILQVKYALKFYEGVVVKSTLELLPGSASVVLETVFNILTTLGNVFPAGEHSSSLISATNLVHQALSQLIRWSDDILLQLSTAGSESKPDPDSSLQSEVKSVVDGLKAAVNNLVQIVIHKAANKIPPPINASPSAYENSFHLLNDKEVIDSSIPLCNPKRTSGVSETGSSVLEDVPSTDWSSDSLAEELELSPPPKPPLPLKSILSDLGGINASSYDCDAASVPPPLPPKKRSMLPLPSPLSPLTLPDLVPSHTWLSDSFDSLAHSSFSEVFNRKIESRWEEHSKNISMTSSQSQTNTSSVFSSVSSSSFSSFNVQSSSYKCTTTSCSSSITTKDLSVHSGPPALPAKRRQKARIRLPSQYDNIIDQPDCNEPFLLADFVALRQEETSGAFHFSEEKSVHSTGDSCNMKLRREFSTHMEQLVTLGEAPPLPPKKKHIKAYMEMVGPYSQPSEVELFHQTMEAYLMKAAQWQEHSEDLFIARASSYLTAPPLLPPKKNKPVTTPLTSERQFEISARETSSERSPRTSLNSPPLTPSETHSSRPVSTEKMEDEMQDGMEQLDLSSDLVLKKPEEDGPEVRGGGLDSLIAHAAKLNKDDYLYQGAFLTTYRTFISPLELTRKLMHRFHYFLRKPDFGFQRAARHAFSLLVLVVDDLALSELDEPLLRQIIDFQSQLVSSGDLVLAKALRKKFLEKCTARRLRSSVAPTALAALGVSTRQQHLLDFKSGELAEQMTLLDAELFLRIEIPEVLVWAQEQNEEKSPNLTLFTEHFNKMSYWARSRILEQNEAKERERYVVKFIKIMKHLRRLNNFNSYLALLSALDSAPVRRLEWQKSITDGLQEYCALIDSSSSFRAYRHALAETQPPCIPYIGLILQDLTFVHIGNPDLLADGHHINFGKRWQQFHILENMRRFQKCHYQFKRNERIVAFFNEFNDVLCEESMWQISESIRPRGSNQSSSKK